MNVNKSSIRLFQKEEVERYYNYSIPIGDFFNCALSVDCTILGYENEELKVLLIKRGAEPFMDFWALPGDLMYPMEELDTAANRVLYNLTGINDLNLRQIATYGSVGRHPVGRVLTVSYFTLVRLDRYNPVAASWAENIEWHSISEIPKLAFDHNVILRDAIDDLKNRVRNYPIGFELLPKKFTLNQIHKIYETILEMKFDKANFRKKLLSMGILIPLEEVENNVSHRPAKLYAFAEEKYNQLVKKGFQLGF